MANEKMIACGTCSGMGVRPLTTNLVVTTIGVGTSPMAFMQTASAVPSPIGTQRRKGHNLVLACCPRCKCEFLVADATPLPKLDQAAKDEFTMLEKC